MIAVGIIALLVTALVVMTLLKAGNPTTGEAEGSCSPDKDIAFSVERLDAAMEIVAFRLNALLAPTNQPDPSGAWPWEAAVDLDRDVVSVVVDPSRQAKDREIKAALADELAIGTVRICYRPVQRVEELKTVSDRRPLRSATERRDPVGGHDA